MQNSYFRHSETSFLELDEITFKSGLVFVMDKGIIWDITRLPKFLKLRKSFYYLYFDVRGYPTNKQPSHPQLRIIC